VATPKGPLLTAAEPPALRRARPEDARYVAPLVLEAAPSLELIFGDRRPTLRAVAAAYRAERTELSFRYGMVAEADRPVGLVIAFPGRLFGSLKLGTGVVLARAAGTRHVADLVKRGRVLDRLIPRPPQDSLYVSVLAVAPDARGTGVGSRLLERVVAAAGRLGRSVCLDVGLDNTDAIRLYERLGFRRTRLRETTAAERRLIPTEGSARMEVRAPRGTTAGP
jgi:ribosomal protein S18 acetylase RimI-like enzyme